MNEQNGIVTIPSRFSFDETVERIQHRLAERGIELFVIVDHGGGAKNAGLEMPPTKLLIFGNPKAGTPLMVASPSAALDLPLKILVAEDAHRQVSISYTSASYLQKRHGFSPELIPNIAAVEQLATFASGSGQ